ncbi:MAG: Methylated-DNA--protein-cysteine methyltransferase [Pseudomonadota bacterium]
MWGESTLGSPIGALLVGADADGVVSLRFEGVATSAPSDASEAAAAALRAWLSDPDAPLPRASMRGGTPFQQRVWTALCAVPLGATATYGDIAAAIGQPTAYRAVGMANHRNPLPILVPCHRIVGQDGRLTGYAGGLWRKAWLLEHEARGVSVHLFDGRPPTPPVG